MSPADRSGLRSLRAAPVGDAHRIILPIVLIAALAGLGREILAADTDFASDAGRYPSAPLDGKAFVGKLLDAKGKVIAPHDVISFQDGNFRSASCVKFGFKDSPYWIRRDGNAIRFLAESASPDHGTIVFRGIVRDDRLEFKGVWTKER